MILHEVHLSKRSQKFLEKLEPETSSRIKNKLRTLSANPVPSEAKFIFRDGKDRIFRLRIGDYRALYKIKDKIVLIIKIDKRERIYE